MRLEPTSARAALRLGVSCALAAGLLACDGQLDAGARAPIAGPGTPGPGTPGPGDRPPDDTPGPDDPIVEPIAIDITAPQARRLTAAQYANTMRAVFGESVVTPERLPKFDDDMPTIGLNSHPANLRVTGINVTSLYDSMERLARGAIEEIPELSACVEAKEEACFGELIDTYGFTLWRRPLEAIERDELLQDLKALGAGGASRSERVEFILRALLASPNALYRTELGASPVESDRALTNYEIASALSYLIWNGPPDEELYRAAAAGELSDPEKRRAQAARMLEDDRSAEAMAAFFMDYLKIDAILRLEPRWPLTSERQGVLTEGVRADLADALRGPNASLLDVFSMQAFRVQRESESFFGVKTESKDEFEITSMDPAERLGVLTHPAYLSAHHGIVRRGVFTLKQLLCSEIGAPPADISGRTDEELPEEFKGFRNIENTTRQVLYVRHSSQADCIGCHNRIDPAGAGLENFDRYGRYRTTESKDEREGGKLIKTWTNPIDASGELLTGRETIAFEDSISYVRALAESEALSACLSKKLFTYALGAEPHEEERALIEAAFLMSGGEIAAVVDALVTTPSFATRRPAPEGDDQ